MKFSYKFTTTAEKHAAQIYFLLVENFSKTFFVGGTVRDMIVGRILSDFDIATVALPAKIISLAKKSGLKVDQQGAKFGVLNFRIDGTNVEVATLRKDLVSDSRYPKVRFIADTKIDSQRRDFTMNSLYFQAKNGEFLDYHKGMRDIQARTIKFIGDPSKRIKEDPLRIARAYRFKLDLGFKFDPATERALEQRGALIKTITRTRIEKEIMKLRTKQLQHKLRTIINKIT